MSAQDTEQLASLRAEVLKGLEALDAGPVREMNDDTFDAVVAAGRRRSVEELSGITLQH